MPSIVVPDRVGVFAFDPGGTTGVGWALMDVKDTVAETLRNADITTLEITGDWKEQARKLKDLWTAVEYEWTVERGLSVAHAHLIREDFNLYKFRSSDKKGVYPIWIGAMLEGLLDGRAVITAQQVVQAKRLATNARLRRWGVYVPGSEHKRDAVRHIAFKLNKVI